MSIECDGAHRCRCDRRSSDRHRGHGHGDDSGTSVLHSEDGASPEAAAYSLPSYK